MSNRDKWSDLSLKKKAALIDIYVKSGITDLEEIRKDYNSFGDGGDTEPLYYDDTYIEPAVVKAFDSIEDYNRYQGRKGAEAVRRGMNKAANTISKGLRYTPVVGDVMDGLEAYEEARTGNLTKAGILAGLTLFPNVLEKPVKAVGKGLKNLRLYNRYVRDVKRFEDPVQFALKGMEKNYDVLKSNFPEMNAVEDARKTMNTTVSTRFDPIEFVLNEIDGHYGRKTGKIWLNAYSPTRLKQAWKSPKKAIKFMKQAATHEGTHSAIDNLNIPMSEKYKKYYRVIPGSTIDNRTKHLYTKANRKGTAWQNLPEEFIAEMNAARYTLGEKPGSSINSWDADHANRSENYLSKRFNFEPGEAGELIDIYENFGFAHGGPINTDYKVVNNINDRNYWFDTPTGKLKYDRAFNDYKKYYDDFLNTEEGQKNRYLQQHTNINKVRKALNKVYPDGGYLDRFEELEPAVVTDEEALTPLQESLRNYFNNKMWDSLLQDKLDRKLKKRNKGSLAGSLVPMIVTSRILDGRETEQTLSGKPVGEGLDTYNHPKYNHDEEAYIYSYLIGRGVPHTQASVIMGNLAVESMLDPHISQIGGGGGYGLIQATDKARKKSFMNYNGQPYEFGSKLDPETQRQLDYIIDKGMNTYTTGEWRRTKNIKGARQARKAFLSAKDIETASNIFTDSYLRPGKPHRKRRLSMSNFFDRKYKNPYEVKFMYE